MVSHIFQSVQPVHCKHPSPLSKHEMNWMTPDNPSLEVLNSSSALLSELLNNLPSLLLYWWRTSDAERSILIVTYWWSKYFFATKYFFVTKYLFLLWFTDIICVTMAHFIGMVTLGYFLVSHHGICGTLVLI